MSRPQTQQSSATPSRSRNAVSESSLCKFPFSDGRRCRMLRHPAHPYLCPFHARAELQLRESASLGTELSTTISGDFMTATDINHVLGKLYTAVAQDRIPARNATTLAYIGQLLLNSVPGIKSEYTFAFSFDQWKEMEQNAQQLSPPPSLSTPATTDDTALAPDSNRVPAATDVGADEPAEAESEASAARTSPSPRVASVPGQHRQEPSE